jgi:hypothetical protein
VSRGSITVIVLSQIPDDFRKVSRHAIKLKATKEGVEKLLSLEFDCAVLEPSGMHYSKIWVHHIANAGKELRWVNHQEIANYRKSWRVSNKNDQLDAIALACYGLERYHLPNHFIQPEREALRNLWLQLKHLNRAKNPIVNRLRQQLAAEFPEVCEKDANRGWLVENPAGLWRFIAGEKPSAKWQTELDASIGIGITPFSRGLARQICEIERQEYEVEQRVAAELQQDKYAPYLKVFEDYAFGARTSAALLSEIYPFERFLKDGKPINDYCNTANSRRRCNRSLGAFKLSCGLGMVQYQSGDSQGWKAGGNSDIRMALWQWCKITIVMKPVESPKLVKLKDYYEHGSKQVINGEEVVFQPGIRNQRVMRVVRRMLEMLYKDLLVTVVK